jgi:hypothetical protein
VVEPRNTGKALQCISREDKDLRTLYGAVNFVKIIETYFMPNKCLEGNF